MRNFLFGTLPICIAFVCISEVSAATISSEETRRDFSEHYRTGEPAERDDGVFFNGALGDWRNPKSGDGNRIPEGTIAPLEGQTLSETLKELNFEERNGDGERDRVFLDEIIPVNPSDESGETSDEALSAVPIPSTVFLLGCGICVLIGLRRRKSMTG